jgi:hypothetical protein
VELDVRGLQIAGAATVVGGDAAGAQLAGLANVVGADFRGLQVAGFANVVGAESRAWLQVAGLANVAGHRAGGLLQASGFANVAGSEAQGLHVTGFANVAGEHLAGVQVAGFANVAGEEVTGVQVAGFANVAGEELRGVQIGVANVAGRCEGLQVGVACVAAEQRGVPVGLYLREESRPRREFLLHAGTLSWAGCGLRTEANRWTAELSLGWGNHAQDVDEALIAGWHFGRVLHRGRGLELGADLGVLWVDNEDLVGDEGEDRLAVQARLVTARPLGDGLALFAGAGVTVLRARGADPADTDPLIVAGVRLY